MKPYTICNRPILWEPVQPVIIQPCGSQGTFVMHVPWLLAAGVLLLGVVAGCLALVNRWNS